jgi:hypothetical protein
VWEGLAKGNGPEKWGERADVVAEIDLDCHSSPSTALVRELNATGPPGQPSALPLSRSKAGHVESCRNVKELECRLPSWFDDHDGLTPQIDGDV